MRTKRENYSCVKIFSAEMMSGSEKNQNGNGNGAEKKSIEAKEPKTNGNPLKFLFVSHESLSGDVAWTLEREGHEVKCFIKAKSDLDVYDGFLEKVERWEDWVEWADIVVFDHVGFGEQAERLRKKGKPVVGGSVYTDRLEIDRKFGQAELKRHGVSILPSWNFDNYDEALEFIRQNPARYVFKPNGNTPSANKNLLFLGEEEDGKDLLEVIGQNKSVWQKKAPVFQLQKFVSGLEVAAGAFFNKTDFILPININFEHKRIFPGEVGPFTGDMGALMFWSAPNTFFKETLLKMLPALRESGYVGYIDINCIVNGRGIYPLEFTARFGYPTIHTQLEGILTSTGEWMSRLARGENFELKTKKGFQVGVEIFVPTHFRPRDKEFAEIYRDLPIFFKKPGSIEGVHLQDVKLADGVWRIAGESGSILVVTGSGATVADAQRQAYSRIQNIMVQNMFYRTDIGSRWVIDSDKLHTWGYLT